MKLVSIAVTQIQENVYFYYDENTLEGIVVDPGGEGDRIEKFITDNNLKIKGILLTHGHFDHIMAAEQIRKLTGAPIIAHKKEYNLLTDKSMNLSVHLGSGTSVTPDILVEENEVFSFDNTNIKVIHTPGHTQGGCCYYDEKEKIIFSGDTLFLESVGRTDFPYSNTDDLINSIQNKLFTLPDETRVYPGHGSSTTIAHEKKYNPEI